MFQQQPAGGREVGGRDSDDSANVLKPICAAGPNVRPREGNVVNCSAASAMLAELLLRRYPAQDRREIGF